MKDLLTTELPSALDGESLSDLCYGPSERLERALDRLAFYLRRGAPRYRDYYVFDVEGDGCRPAKFEKMQVYRALTDVIACVEVTREYFYHYVATHTNLGRNARTVKTMMGRCT